LEGVRERRREVEVEKKLMGHIEKEEVKEKDLRRSSAT